MINNIYFLSILKKSNTIILGLIASIFLNRALGPALRGDYAYIQSNLTILNMILIWGISNIFPYYYRKREDWTITTFFVCVSLQFVILSTIGTMVSLLKHSLDMGVWVFVVTTSVYESQLLNMTIVTNFKNSVIANTCGLILNAILMIVMFGLHISSLQFAFIALILKSSMIVIVSIKSLKPLVNLHLIRHSVWGSILYAGTIPMATNLMIMLNYKVDIIILKLLTISSSSIGLYSVGVSLAEYAWIIPDIFKEVIISKTARSDNIDEVSFCLRLSSSALTIIFFGILFLGKYIITILYGVAYTEAYRITCLVFAGIFSMVYCKLLGVLYLAQGKWKFYFFVLLGSVLINVIINLILIPVWSIYGSALASVISYSFAGLYFALSFKKRYGLKLRDIVFINKKDIYRLIRFYKSKEVAING